MDQDLIAVLKDIAELIRLRSEEERLFRESALEELKALNRTIERICDKESGGSL